MATTITAGNATNGIVITPDNTGILELKTGTGAGTTALTLNASQNATFAGTLQVAGVATNMYPIVSGTAVASTSGTSIPFTGIPSWAKRITVMFQSVSTNGTNILQVQIGTGGSATTSGYLGGYIQGSSVAAATLPGLTTGFIVGTPTAINAAFHGSLVITQLSSATNSWTCTGNIADSTNQRMWPSAGSVSLSGVLDNLRVIASATGSPSDTFDAGTINIMWE